MKWDWYEATIHDLAPADVQRTLATCSVVLGENDWIMVGGRFGYLGGLKRGSERGGTITTYEGRGEVHVIGTGPMSPRVAGLMRRTYPGHSVSRADVALDVDVPGVFTSLWRRVHVQALGMMPRPVTTELAGDWVDAERGRTFYAGGRTSRLRVRVYEKGIQELGRDPTCGASRDWVRVEWQLRPSSAQKVWLGAAELAEAVALTRFGAVVAEDLLADGEFDSLVPSELRHASTHAAMWMVRHYKKVLGSMLDLGPDELHRQLLALVERYGPEFGTTTVDPAAVGWVPADSWVGSLPF